MTKLVEQFIAEQFLAKQTEVKNRKRNWLNLLSNYLLSKNYNQPISVLQIELGRYKKIILPDSVKPVKMPKELRLCVLCDANEVESEFHFLMSCPHYDKAREIFFQQLSNIFPNILSFDATAKFKFILACGDGDYNISKLICNFINELHAQRSAFLSVSQPDPAPSRDTPVTTRVGR